MSRLFVLATLAFVSVTAAPGVYHHLTGIGRATFAEESRQVAASEEQLGVASDLSAGFQRVARAMRPSVVSVSSVKKVDAANLNAWRDQLGAIIQDMSEDLAASFGYDQKGGVLIGDVTPKGPAAKAGIKSGDIIILLVDGKPIVDVATFRRLLGEKDLSKGVLMQVMRDNVRRFVFVKMIRWR